MKDIDFAILRKQAADYNRIVEEHDYDLLPEHISLTDFCDNVVTYIGGYVIKMLTKILHCEECFDMILLEKDAVCQKKYTFMKRRDLGRSIVV